MFTRGAFLALAPGLVAVQHFNALTPPPEETFAPDVVRGDLDAIWTTLIAVGAQPFRTSNPADVEALYHKARAAITSPMTVRQAWLAIAPVLGALNDGHVGLLFPNPLNSAPQRFPLRFALVGRRCADRYRRQHEDRPDRQSHRLGRQHCGQHVSRYDACRLRRTNAIAASHTREHGGGVDCGCALWRRADLPRALDDAGRHDARRRSPRIAAGAQQRD